MTSSSTDPEKIVAYLDGELPDEEAETIEELLAADAALRTEVERLTKSWDLLDLLPSGRAPADFSQRTLSAVRAEALTTLAEVPAGGVPERRSIAWKPLLARLAGRGLVVAVLVALATVSFRFSARRGADAVQELLTELPLLERLPEYRDAGDIEFLHELHRSGVMNDRESANRD